MTTLHNLSENVNRRKYNFSCQTNFLTIKKYKESPVDLLLYSKLAVWPGIRHTDGFQGNSDLDFTISHSVGCTTDLTNGNLGKLGAVFGLKYCRNGEIISYFNALHEHLAAHKDYLHVYFTVHQIIVKILL